MHPAATNASYSKNDLQEQLHQKALEACTRYKKAEAELITILQQVDQHRVFLKKGYSSLFLYIVKELGLSESVAYNLIAVSRKAREVPELKREIENGSITISNARMVAPVLNQHNKDEWLKKAAELSQRQLQKEIVKIRPEVVTPERVAYVTEKRVKLELGLPEKEMLRLRRVQDLLCQSRGCSVNLEEVLVALVGDYLKRNDPVEKAKRQCVKKGFTKKGFAGNLSINEAKDRPAEAKGRVAEVQDQAAGQHISSEDITNEDIANGQPVAIQAPSEIKRRSGATESADHQAFAPRMPMTAAILPRRKPIPAMILHQIMLRDRGRCTYQNQRGQRCTQMRWLHIHHKIPVSQGGGNNTANLTTLCSTHHQLVHAQAISTPTTSCPLRNKDSMLE